MPEDSKQQNHSGTDPGNPTPLQWTPELTQRFWNYHSRFPDAYFTEQYGPSIIETVSPYLGSQPRILDYACGTGALTGLLLRHGLNVAACDISADSLAHVQSLYHHHPNFIGTLGLGELEAGGGFDVAMLVELVEHVGDDVLTQILDDLWAALKPGGRIVITTPNEECLDVDTVYCPQCNHTFHRWQHVRSWSAQSLGTFLAKHRFQQETVLKTDFSLSARDGRIRYAAKKMMSRLLNRKAPHLVLIARRLDG